MPRPINNNTEKIYCVEYRLREGEPLLRYICKAVDPREAEKRTVKAFGRNISIYGRPRVMSRSTASAALLLYSGFAGEL